MGQPWSLSNTWDRKRKIRVRLNRVNAGTIVPAANTIPKISVNQNLLKFGPFHGANHLYILSGHIGKVVALHAAVALIYNMHETLKGTAHEGGGCDQSIGSIVSDAIVHSWLWLTETRSSPLGCFSRLLQVLDNWPHILW